MSQSSNTGTAQRRIYLPRGLRGRLATKFGVSMSTIDWRIRHDETLEAARLKASTLEAALHMLLGDMKGNLDKKNEERHGQ